MATGTLYTYPENFRAYKALIAAQYSGAQVNVSKDFKFGETNKTAGFLAKFPLGKVPAFEASNGDCVFESNAIAQYVSFGNAQLLGSSSTTSALIQQWINFGDNEILPGACTWVFPCLGITSFNKQESEKAKEQVKKAMTVLNNYLNTRTYLVGERITQADISVACNLMMLYKYVMDSNFRQPYVNVNRWFTTLINQPEFSSVIGTFKLCEKMAEPDGKKYAELHGGAGGGKKEKKEKKEKQEKPKKETPKKKEPEPEEEEDDMPKVKESKDPFADLPKGTFNMDEFKREYSNKDTLTEALPYFWKNFDHENLSIWYCEYKYSDELTKIFMTSNLVGGMFQRIDRMRKNAFASMCIFGEDNNNSISGVWFWRGHNLAFELSPDWGIDYDSYTWKKLDSRSKETEELVNEYFAWEGNFGGKKFNQGKIFK